MIVIIGSGLAGYMLAKELRKLDKTVPLTIITQSRGDFYSKPLLSTALTQGKSAQELVINSAMEMANQLDATIHAETEVESIQPGKRIISFAQQTLKYHQLILACGSRPIQLQLAGDAAASIHAVNDLEAYADFRMSLQPSKRHLAILGSGLVGCEFANDLITSGYELDIVSLDAYPLARFVPEPLGRALQAVFAEKGVRWHLNTGAQRVERVAEGYRMICNNGRELSVAGVLSAVGLTANTQLAQAAGLAVERGIVVNQYLQTSDPHIYALGDCAQVMGQVKQYVAPLLQCARTLAKVLTGETVAVEYPCMPVVIKTSLCPVVTCPAPNEVAGEWRYAGTGKDMRALFYDQQEQLRGFALSGDMVRDKLSLVKQLML